MKNIYLKVTDGCNLRCSHCYVKDLNNYSLQDIEKVKKFINSVYLLDKDITVLLHGGEPLLAPYSYLTELRDAIWEISPDIRISMQSNILVKLTDEILSFLKTISIGTSYDHGNVRFKTEKMKKIWEDNLSLLFNELGYKLGIVTTFSNELVSDDPKRVLDYFNSIDISSVLFEKIVETPNTYTGSYSSPSYSKVDDFYSSFIELYLSQPNNFKILGPLSDSIYQQSVTQCYQCSETMLTLMLNGDVCECPTTYDKIGTIGQDYKEIAKSLALNKLHLTRANRISKCNGCEFLSRCKFGSCYKLGFRDGECPGYPKTLTKLGELHGR